MNRLKTLIILLSILFCQQVANAQAYFKDFLKEEGVVFKKPLGYEFAYNDGKDTIEFFCRNKRRFKDDQSGEYYVYNKDRSVMITITEWGWSDDPRGKNPSMDENYSFYLQSGSRADSTKFPLRFMGSQELKTYNADAGAEYRCNCNVPDNKSGYVSNRIIYLAKAFQSNISLAYLFKDTSIAAQNKIINATKGFLTFITKPKTFSKDSIFNRHFVNAFTPEGYDTLSTRWNRGGVYEHLFINRELYAFKSGDVIISVQFPFGSIWPYFNTDSKRMFDIIQENVRTHSENWQFPDELKKANDEFETYLSLAKGKYKAISAGELAKWKADKGYIFEFEHRPGDLYRDKYAKCRVVMLHKNNIGTMVLKYYYHDPREVDLAIAKTMGFARFKN